MRRLEPLRVGDQEHVLGDRAHERCHRRLLEGIGADRGGRHLAADHHDRHRIGHAVAHRRDRVGGARARGDQADADPAAGARIAGRHEPAPCSLAGTISGICAAAGAPLRLVVDEDGVVGRQDRAAAVAEDGLDALVGEHLHDDLARRDMAWPASGCVAPLDWLADGRSMVRAYQLGAARTKLGYSAAHPAYRRVGDGYRLMRHIIGILLQNEAGALARVAGMFSSRGYNIESLSVAPDRRPDGLAPDAGDQRLGRGDAADRQSAQQAHRRGAASRT